MNEELLNRKDLLNYLVKLDDSLEYEIDIILMGGSALNLLGNKTQTVDIDFIYVIAERLKEDFIKKAREIADKTGITAKKIHIFSKDEAVSLTGVFDFIDRVSNVKEISFKHIHLKVMNVYDVIITKIARFDARDIKDLINITKQFEISLELIDRRFNILYRYQEDKKSFARNYQQFKELCTKYLK